MKALVLEKFGSLVVEELPAPEPAAGEVLIQVVVTGICGSDIHGFTGENGRRVLGQVMGHESVGHVIGFGTGADGSGLSLGQAVTFNPVVVPESELEEYAGREQHSPGKYVIGVRSDVVSAFAQLIAVPRRNVFALPEGVPIIHGALVEPLAVAIHAVRRVEVEPGQLVLVVGGGPIGQSVVLALRVAGVTSIVVSELTPARRAMIQALGASTIDPSGAPLCEQVIAEFGRLADVAIDAVGVSRTLADSLVSTRLGGKVCLVGMGAPSVDLQAFDVSTEERSIIGSFTYSARDFADAVEWIAADPTGADAMISRQVSLDDANDAFVALAEGDGTAGKVLVRLDGAAEAK